MRQGSQFYSFKSLFTLFVLVCFTFLVTAQEKNVSIVIHGGAGTILRENMTPEREAEYKGKLTEALEAGYSVLENGGSSTDAVIAAIMVMENSPLFNAGKGAVFTSEGKNELDASLMEGKTGLAGAVAGVTTIKNPILAARAVMEKSEHVMLSGKGAEEFARMQGLEMVEPEYFYTESRYKSLERAKEREKRKGQQGYRSEDNDYKYGTVGAVALDANGNISAGTSTGGMTNKRYGRIGDAPIIGAGTYAENDVVGVSCTGHGEFFIRNVVAYDVAAIMKYQSKSLDEATREVVQNKLKKIDGGGGLIALDKQGNVSMEFNTPGMYRGYMKSKGSPMVFIYND